MMILKFIAIVAVFVVSIIIFIKHVTQEEYRAPHAAWS
jgi:hypothetical protein